MLAVITTDGQRLQIDAATWHVDETHGLHLRSAKKEPIASFAPTKWVGVVKVPNATA